MLVVVVRLPDFFQNFLFSLVEHERERMFDDTRHVGLDRILGRAPFRYRARNPENDFDLPRIAVRRFGAGIDSLSCQTNIVVVDPNQQDDAVRYSACELEHLWTTRRDINRDSPFGRM